MASCPACSHACPDGGRYCPYCSAPLDVSAAETAVMGAAVSTSHAPSLSSSSSVDEGRFLPGTVIAGRYRVAQLLGRGGMGEVYRATDLTLGQAVALKFLPEATASDERALIRFYNEVRVARQVTHPNVCRVYDVGQVQSLHYISMEFVDGEDLGSLLRRIGRLPVDKAEETARRICAGLAAAHEKGVLHRDLKPANIMIDGRGQVIIMDFGLAGLAGQLQGDVRSGTPAYMSPEQLAGTEVTFKSDIYALGLLLYEIFTGKRAYEASSLIELMHMQERAAPQSITTMVKDVDPAVERVILRCLSRDPQHRPASALAVAAALPGGDPLAAALAAGETPSPELVAAAGETEGLAPKAALIWLAAAIVGLAATTYLAPRESITGRLNLETPPEALTRDARAMIRGFGYTTKPADSAWGLDYDGDYRRYLARHPKEAAARWANPAVGQPPFLYFWYRESPQPIAASRRFDATVRYDNPPLETSGMVRLQTDADGKLLAFEAVPPQVEKPAPPAPAFDWSRLFTAAGLNFASFQATEPTWTPLLSWDARAAWTGTDPATGASLRVEAAAWRGKPVFFRIIGPWTVANRMTSSASNMPLSVFFIVYGAIIAACVIGWLNHRAGRLDAQGATRLFLLYCLSAVSGLISAHHVATQSELNQFWMIVSAALINGMIVWLFYAALEPWVRRKWPQTVISWSRYVSRGIRDPLVGRDLLYGIVFGLIMHLAGVVSPTLHGNSGHPSFPPLETLTSGRLEIAALINTIPPAVISSTLFFFVLFVLRLMIRNQWATAIVFVAMVSFAFTSDTTTPAVDYSLAVVAYSVYAFAMMRCGLLAALVSSATAEVLLLGTPLDFSAWYAGMAAVPLLLVLGVAVYAFKTSLGGRRLFQLEA